MAREYPPRPKFEIINSTSAGADANKRYVDWQGISWGNSIGQTGRKQMSRPGRVTKVTVASSNDSGSTAVGVHVNLNTTADETVTEGTDPGAGVMGEFLFTSNSFVAGDMLSVSVDPTNIPGISIAEITIEYD